MIQKKYSPNERIKQLRPLKKWALIDTYDTFRTKPKARSLTKIF